MNRLVELQARRNAESRANWECSAGHRERTMQLIAESAGAGHASLCLLGAGNCNDVDLAELARRFREVHLVDVDAGALAEAARRQGVADSPSIHLHGNCDVTGIWSSLADWSPNREIDRRDVERVKDAAREFRPPVPKCDVVVSACLLSQLIEGIVRTLGENHADFLGLMQIVRQRHIELLVDATRAGGAGLLITDVVSSESVTQLSTIADVDLPRALMGLVQAGNFFHGLNPAVIESLFRTEPRIASQVESVEILPPWLWDFGVRHYAVLAIRFLRRSVGEQP